jgi:putative membrane protein
MIIGVTRRSLDGPRIVDGEGEMLGRLRCGGHKADPVRRLDAVPALAERSPPSPPSAHRIAPHPLSWCEVVTPSTTCPAFGCRSRIYHVDILWDEGRAETSVINASVVSSLPTTTFGARCPMIERYSDHAANERTFLAWVRTAIAIMAFGFLVQKFDLFLRIASQSLAAGSLPAGSQVVGNIAGLLLIVLGGMVMAFAAIRFRKTTRDIDAKEVRPGPGERLDITLVALLLLLGAILFVYLVYTGIRWL